MTRPLSGVLRVAIRSERSAQGVASAIKIKIKIKIIKAIPKTGLSPNTGYPRMRGPAEVPDPARYRPGPARYRPPKRITSAALSALTCTRRDGTKGGSLSIRLITQSVSPLPRAPRDMTAMLITPGQHR